MRRVITINAATGQQTRASQSIDESVELAKNPTPLQVLEEMEAREEAGRIPTLTLFMQLMTDVERLKFSSARVIHRQDSRISQFGAAFGMTPSEIDQFMTDAANRETTQ